VAGNIGESAEVEAEIGFGEEDFVAEADQRRALTAIGYIETPEIVDYGQTACSSQGLSATNLCRYPAIGVVEYGMAVGSHEICGGSGIFQKFLNQFTEVAAEEDIGFHIHLCVLVLKLGEPDAPFFLHVNSYGIEQLIRPFPALAGERTKREVDAIHRRSAHNAYNPVRFFHSLRALQK